VNPKDPTATDSPQSVEAVTAQTSATTAARITVNRKRADTRATLADD
jgi:hypothetical protein